MVYEMTVDFMKKISSKKAEMMPVCFMQNSGNDDEKQYISVGTGLMQNGEDVPVDTDNGKRRVVKRGVKLGGAK